MSKLKVVLVVVVDSKDANDITLGLSELCMRMREAYHVPNWAVMTFKPQDEKGVEEFIRTTAIGRKP